MELVLYILYAFIQAILVARYILQEKEAPVTSVVMMTIFGPLTTIMVLVFFGHYLITWAVTGKRP